MQIINRTGTGSSSDADPCTLNFNFAPEYIFVIFSTSLNNGPESITSIIHGATMSEISTSYTNDKIMMSKSSGKKPYIKKSSDGKIIYWYIKNASDQSYIYNELTTGQLAWVFLGIL